MVFPRQYRAVYTGSGVPLSFPSPVKLLCCRCYLNFRRPATYTCHVIGARCCKEWATHPVLKNIFSFFRFSFCHTSHLSPFPFSAIAQVIHQHTRNLQNLTGRLYFVCNRCWIYLRHVSTLHEPCRGCAMMDSMDWEF